MSSSTIDTSAYTLTFDDEFNTLNLQQQGKGSGWATAYDWDSYNTESAHTISGESEIYVDPTFAGSGKNPLGLNPFSISNGVLSISASPTPSADQSLLWGHNYTSGVLTTASSFTQTYGYFEMRAELPSGQGAFPAFWLLSADGKYNEIDVMEAVNGQNHDWLDLHYTPAGATSQSGFQAEANVPGMTTGFHTYGLLWTAQNITWFVDGTAVATTATPAVMNSPMYMLVNYAVGGSWAGAPNGSALSDMQVDYVRAYSLDSTPTSITTAAQSAASTAPETATSTASQPSTAPQTTTSVAPSQPGVASHLSISADSATHTEGNSGTSYATFTVTRTGDLGSGSTASWTVSGSGAHPADASDFGGNLPSGTVYFGGGENSKTIWVPISGDKTVEPDEGFTVTLSNPTGSDITTASASTTIVNDDASSAASAPALVSSSAPTLPASSTSTSSATTTSPPATTSTSQAGPDISISADHATYTEGKGGTSYATFTVTRTGDLDSGSTAHWAVSGSGDHPADASDFGGSLPSGTVYFGGGENSKTIWVPISGDKTAEPDEGFTVTLSSPTGADITTASASATIVNDDGAYTAQSTDPVAAASQTVSSSVSASANVHTGSAGTDYFQATGGSDVFVLGQGSTDYVFNFDPAHDTLQAHLSDFPLSNTAASGGVNMVDVANTHTSVAGANLIRWTGDPKQMDSVDKVDAALASLPGHSSGGVFVEAYSPGLKAAIYYDAHPGVHGGTELVMVLDNITDTHSISSGDFNIVG